MFFGGEVWLKESCFCNIAKEIRKKWEIIFIRQRQHDVDIIMNEWRTLYEK